MDRRHQRIGTLVTLMVGLILPTTVVVARMYVPSVEYKSFALHACLEAGGSVMAILIGLMFFLFRRRSHRGSEYLWLSASLMSMAILSAVHGALSTDGDLFVFLEVMSNVVGGLFALGVWLPKLSTKVERKNLLFGFAIGMSALIAAVACAFPNLVPRFVDGEAFTKTCFLAGALSTICFLAAATRFFKRYLDHPTWDDLFLGNFLLLTGVTGVLPHTFLVWGPLWWSWHVVQLLAYISALSFLVVIYLRLDKALRESEDRYRILAEASFESILVTHDGKIRDFNKAFEEFTGYAPQEVRGRRLSDFVHWEFRRYTNADVSLDQAIPQEITAIRKDGSTAVAEVRTRALPSNSRGKVVVLRDITVKKQIETEVRRLSVELARAQSAASPSDYALSVFQEPFRPVSCQEAFQEAIKSLQSLVETTNAKISYDALPTVFGERALLVELFRRLVDHAIRGAKQSKPEIRLSVVRSDGGWKFTLDDNATEPKCTYTICQSIIEQHGGRVWKESDDLPKFSFTLPATPWMTIRK